MTTFRRLMPCLLLAALSSAQAQVQTMRPGSYGFIAEQEHALMENLARDVAYQAGRLRPEEQVRPSGFWDLLKGKPPQAVARDADLLSILGDAEARKRLRAEGFDILDAVDDRDSGLQLMVLMERDTADRIRALRNSGTAEGLAQARALQATRKAYLPFRGTELTMDRLADLSTDLDRNGRVGKSQYDSQRAALAEICGSYGNLRVTGHSLGGAQAQRFAANCPASVKEVVTFAAPAIGRDEAELFAATPDRPKVTHYTAKDDLVALLGGQNHLPGTVREVSFAGVKPITELDPGSLLESHSRPMLAGGDGVTIQERDYEDFQLERISQHYEMTKVMDGVVTRIVDKGMEKLAEKGAATVGQAVAGPLGGMVAGGLAKSQAGWMSGLSEQCNVLSKAYKASACNGLVSGMQTWARIGRDAAMDGIEYLTDVRLRLPVGPQLPTPELVRAKPSIDPALRFAGVPVLPPDTPQETASGTRPVTAAESTPAEVPAAPAAPAALFVDATTPEDEAAFRASLQQQRESAFAQSDAQVTQMSDQQRAELHRQQDEGRAQLRAGLQSLAMGLAAAQQQQQAYNVQMEAQRQAQNARMAQASQEAMARGQNRITQAGQLGYPVLDPFAARYQQQRQQAQVAPPPQATTGQAFGMLMQQGGQVQAPAITPSAPAQGAGAYPVLDPFASRASAPSQPAPAGASSNTGSTLYWAVVTHSIIPGDSSRYHNNCTVVAGTRTPPATPCGKEKCGTTPYTGQGAEACSPKRAYTGAVRVVGPFSPQSGQGESAEAYCGRVMAAPYGLVKMSGTWSFFCL